MDLDLADVGVGVKLYHAPLTDCRGRGVVPGRRVAAAHFAALDARLAAARDAVYDAAVRSAASGLEAVHCEFGRDAIRQMATATPATVAAADVEPPPRVLRGPVLHCSDRADARTGTVAADVAAAVRGRRRWALDGYRAAPDADAAATVSGHVHVTVVPHAVAAAAAAGVVRRERAAARAGRVAVLRAAGLYRSDWLFRFAVALSRYAARRVAASPTPAPTYGVSKWRPDAPVAFAPAPEAVDDAIAGAFGRLAAASHSVEAGEWRAAAADRAAKRAAIIAARAAR